MPLTFEAFWLAHIRTNPVFAKPETTIRVKNLEALLRDAYTQGGNARAASLRTELTRLRKDIEAEADQSLFGRIFGPSPRRKQPSGI